MTALIAFRRNGAIYCGGDLVGSIRRALSHYVLELSVLHDQPTLHLSARDARDAAVEALS